MAAEPTYMVGNTELFQELENYNWDQDAEFQVSESGTHDGVLQPRHQTFFQQTP
jgi:hypothetical protein